MKKLGGILLTHEPFSEIVMGNTALVRAMIESGTRVVTSYPGNTNGTLYRSDGRLDGREHAEK